MAQIAWGSSPRWLRSGGLLQLRAIPSKAVIWRRFEAGLATLFPSQLELLVPLSTCLTTGTR